MPNNEEFGFDPNSDENPFEAILRHVNRRFDELLAAVSIHNIPVEMEWFSPKQVADILDKKPFTVREWCRLGRINNKRLNSGERRISRDEVQRYRRDGLLP